MRSDPGRVDAVLGALADPTRRSIFETVAFEGPLTATSLATAFPVSRQAVTKHLDRLADADLVDRTRVGREIRWSAAPGPLDELRVWVDHVGTAWDRRLDALSRRVADD